MKILIIGSIPNNLGGKYYGGVATHISGLSENLASKGNDVSVWYHRPHKEIKTKSKVKVIGNSKGLFIFSLIKGFYIFFNKRYNYLDPRKRLLFIFQVQRLKSILKRDNYDIIHVHSLRNTSSLALQYLKSKIPYVITDHGFWQEKDFFVKGTPIFKRISDSVNGAKKVIYISDFALEKHKEINFGQRNKLIKIKNPISVNEFKYTIKKSNNFKKTIFFNGFTESIKRKNLSVLLDAIQSDKDLRTRVKLIVISNKDGIKYIKNNRFSFPIDLHGTLPLDKIEKMYLASDLLVVPSKSESFGLVYIEALLLGVPIIGFKPVIDEFKQDIGYYIGEGFDSKIETAKDLAKKIKKVLSTVIEKEHLIEKVKHIYSWRQNIDKYIDLYSDSI